MTVTRAVAALVGLTAGVTLFCLVALAQTTPQAARQFAHVIDLTHTLDEDTPYIPVPGITFPFKKSPIATVAKNGVAAYRWEIHEHLGTQIDAPNHFFEQARLARSVAGRQSRGAAGRHRRIGSRPIEPRCVGHGR